MTFYLTVDERPQSIILYRFANFTHALEQIVRMGESRIGIYHSGRQNRFLSVVNKFICHLMSMGRILGVAAEEEFNEGLVDHFTVLALTRVALEAHLMAMYISKPDLDEIEYRFRRALLVYHDNTNRRIFLGSLSQNPSLKSHDLDETGYRRARDASLEEIRYLGKMLRIKRDQVEQIIRERRVFHGGVRAAAKEAGWSARLFDFQQSYLSAYVHTHPVSFMRVDSHQIGFEAPSEFQLGVVAFCLQFLEYASDTLRFRMADFTGHEVRDVLHKLSPKIQD